MPGRLLPRPKSAGRGVGGGHHVAEGHEVVGRGMHQVAEGREVAGRGAGGGHQLLSPAKAARPAYVAGSALPSPASCRPWHRWPGSRWLSPVKPARGAYRAASGAPSSTNARAPQVAVLEKVKVVPPSGQRPRALLVSSCVRSGAGLPPDGVAARGTWWRRPSRSVSKRALQRPRPGVVVRAPSAVMDRPPTATKPPGVISRPGHRRAPQPRVKSPAALHAPAPPTDRRCPPGRWPGCP